MNVIRILAMLILMVGMAVVTGPAQRKEKFLADDPLSVDPDRNPIPLPRARDLSQIYDLIENTWLLRPKKDEVVFRAENVNTLGEVPDSSWFNSRMGGRRMTLAELVRGPNQFEGPDHTQPWILTSVKTQGITPGFTIRDGRGDTYYVKFDPPENPQLMTSTEVIATKFFHAFGFNVPQNYLSFVRRKDLLISSEARLTEEDGTIRAVQEEDIDKIFDRVYRGPDGTTPVVASLRLKGRPLGPFKYHGTRSDDANDIFPHENRRELRGLRLFAAWMNHDDSRSINSLDIYVGEPGLGHVEHYLIDFGSCFGSGSVKVQSRRAGNEYMVEFKPILKASLTLGIWDRAWRHFPYPDYPAIGRFEGDFFTPELWRPEYPNPAFERMQLADAFWAVRIISRFTDEMIRAIVKTGKIENPSAEDYLVQTLIKRRDKIVAHYLPRLSALDEFKVERRVGSPSLNFQDLLVETGIVQTKRYEYEWFRFDNSTLERTLLENESARSTSQTSIRIPQDHAEFLMVRILSGFQQSGTGHQVDVYLRNGPSPRIVGIDRSPHR